MLIGRKIKELRKARKLKLIELAKETGIQIATLSRIEHERMTGTLASHMKIAAALGVELTELYQTLVDSSKIPTDTVNTKSHTEAFNFSKKASYKILANNAMNKKMLPTMVFMEPGGSTEKEQSNPGTERFIFTIKGKVSAYVGDKIYKLKVNNALYLDASAPHWFENRGISDAKFLSITTQPTL